MLASIIVIRREQPRTKDASPTEYGLSHSRQRGFSFPRAQRPLLVVPHYHAFLIWTDISLCGSFGLFSMRSLHGDPYGPYESQHLPRHRGDNLLFRFSSAQESHISTVQAVACLRRNLLYLGTQTLLALARGSADQRFVPLRPCCLNYDSPQCCFPLKIDPFFRRILTHPVDLQCTAITPFCRSSSHP